MHEVLTSLDFVLRELSDLPEVVADLSVARGRYASREGIPFVWFPSFRDGRSHEVEEPATGAQVIADPLTWSRVAGR
ncbi:hypothetical protein [Saccharothrix sp. HUAS TT1]|uniref:hypothetical protein n=1 Tax=unclassified Saccharothrix TaxID=2593673 RepID=UPI00345BCC00